MVTFIFWFQPDAFAALLVLPRWMWIGPGLVIALLGWTRQRKRMAGLAVLLWLLYAAVFLQEFRHLIELLQVNQDRGYTRVVPSESIVELGDPLPLSKITGADIVEAA